MTVKMYNYVDEFTGKMLRVRTNRSHYRGMCATIGPKRFDIVLKNVFEKTPSGWIQISDLMIVSGKWIESIYVENAFPFDEHEKIILSVEDGEVKIDNEI